MDDTVRRREALDPAAVEAAARAIADVDGSEAWSAYMDEATAAITAYLDRSGLAEARASLELFRQGMADMEASKDEAVARAEKAERERDIERTSVEQLLAELAEARASLERIAVAEGGALHAATIAREALAALSKTRRLP